MMLVADPVIGVPDLFDSDLPILMRQRDQLASRMFLRRSTLIGINVRIIAAQNGVVRTIQSLQSKHVSAGPVEGEENIDAGSEMLFKFRHRGARVIVVAISAHVPLVGAHNGIENFRMNSSIVVAGETTFSLNQNLRHIESM